MPSLVGQMEVPAGCDVRPQLGPRIFVKVHLNGPNPLPIKLPVRPVVR